MKYFDTPYVKPKTLVLVFLLKTAAGTVLWWIYTHHYSTGDLMSFFNNGNVLHQLLIKNSSMFYRVVFQGLPYPELQYWNSSFEHILFNDARTMILLNTIFRFFSFGFFHIHTLFICFISFIGLFGIYKTFLKYFEKQHYLLFVAVFLIPSVLFWGSGVLKEGLLLFGIGLLLYHSELGLRKKYSLQNFLFICFSLIVLIAIKFYVLIALLPGLAVNIIVSRTGQNKIILKYLIVVLVLGLIAFLFSYANPNYNPLNIVADKQAKSISAAQGGVFLVNKNNFVCVDFQNQNKFLNTTDSLNYTINNGSNYLQWKLEDMNDTTFVTNSTDTSCYKLLYKITPVNHAIKITRLKPELISFLKNSPVAIFNVLCTPFIFSYSGILQFIPAFENLIFILLIFISFVFLRKKNNFALQIYFCLSFVIILFLLVGFTTPVVGSIVRYKTPALPFLLIAILLSIDSNKILKLISTSKKQ